MRFAGQNFRAQRQTMPRQRAESGSVPTFAAPASVSGLERAMINMPEKNASTFAFTAMPEMSITPFNLPEFNEQQFKPSGRI
jgi:hypothetical protein